MDARVTAFAENVRRAREAQRISQENLAHLARVHRTTVGLIERHERTPGLDMVLKLCDALGVEEPCELLASGS